MGMRLEDTGWLSAGGSMIGIVRKIDWEPGNGGRYVVIGTRLPALSTRYNFGFDEGQSSETVNTNKEGGAILVTTYWPHKGAMIVSSYVAPDYLMEKVPEFTSFEDVEHTCFVIGLMFNKFGDHPVAWEDTANSVVARVQEIRRIRAKERQ
jgi:hypothetical protein